MLQQLLHVIAHRPDNFSAVDYLEKRSRKDWAHRITGEENVVFLEVAVLDPSSFNAEVTVHGLETDGQKILAASGVRR